MLSPAFQSDSIIANYIRELRKARWAARMVGILHCLSRFLALCSFTWATVVLLGAFVSDIYITDYFSVSSLLLLEATRFALSAFFIQLLTRRPDSGHLNHGIQIYATDDPFLQEQIFRLLFSPFLQVLLIVSSFICSICGLLETPTHYSHFTHNLQISLRIFYILVICNDAISSLALLCAFMAWICLKHPCEQSILRYYDEVLRHILMSGVLQSDSFNFFQFAFRMLGRENARCKGWTMVVEAHKNLLLYLYAHKQGADYLQICLDSEDASVRQAAANTVGVWADEKCGLGLLEFELPRELLMKLADMVGTGEVGRAATNSFAALAKRNPRILLQTKTSSKQPVLHKLAELVDGSSRRSLAAVRTLVVFYNKIYSLQLLAQSEVGMKAMTKVTPATAMRPAGTTAEAKAIEGWALPRDIEDDLVSELKQLLKSSSVHRLRIQSAYLLYLLGKLDPPCHNLITAINPSTDLYCYAKEMEMLKFFLANMPPLANKLPSEPFYLHDVYRDEEEILPPPRHVHAAQNELVPQP